MAKALPTPREILERVSAVLETALLPDEEIKLHKEISKDLGAESIDFLDLGFRLTKEFELGDARIFGDEFQKVIKVLWILLLSPEERERHKTDPLSEAEITSIKKVFPFLGIPPKQGAKIQQLVTVELYCKFIAAKLGVEWITPTDL